jgi:hypothetical protein
MRQLGALPAEAGDPKCVRNAGFIRQPVRQGLIKKLTRVLSPLKDRFQKPSSNRPRTPFSFAPGAPHF